MWTRSQTSGDWSGDQRRASAGSSSGSSSASVRARAACSSSAIVVFGCSSVAGIMGARRGVEAGRQDAAVRTLLILCSAARDLAAVAAAGLGERYRVVPVGEDADAGPTFDPEAIVREAELVGADGVVGTKDRSALLAAIIAERRSLPGPTPRAVLWAQHKLRSRELQRRAAPEAVPRFGDVEPPCFAKPVVGRLSQGAFRLERGSAPPP